MLMKFWYRRNSESTLGVGRGYLGTARYPLQMKEQYHGAYAEYRRDTPGTKAAGYKDRKVLPEGFWQILYIFNQILVWRFSIRAGTFEDA